MTLYHVYLRREIGVKFLDIEADSPEEAASTVRGMATGFADRIDDCEDLSARIDVAEPGQAQPAVTLDFPAGRIRQAAPKLLAALKKLMPFVQEHHEELFERWRENSHAKNPDEAVDADLEEKTEAYRQVISAAHAVLAEATTAERTPL